MKIIGLFLMALGLALFYGVFFKLAPYVASLLPQSDWIPILRVLVYVAVIYVGGITIPLTILILGIVAFFVD